MTNKGPFVEIAKKVCPGVITIVITKDLPKIEGFYLFPLWGEEFIFPKFKKEKEKTKNYAVHLFPWENKVICFGKEITKEGGKVIGGEIQNIPPIKYDDWIKKVVDEESVLNRHQIINKDKIVKGDVMHKILSYISNLYGKDVNSEIKNAVEKTKHFFPYINNWQHFEDIIVNFVFASDIEKYFFVSDAEDIYCEKEMISLDGSVYRIDRLIVKNNEVWVVDYKISFDVDEKIMDGYIEQVKKYKELVSKIYPNKIVKGFLLSIDNYNIINV